MKYFLMFLIPIAICTQAAHAGIVTFGSGANQFDMVFVKVGDAGNAADATGDPNPAGAVSYVYEMGKFEVSRNMITKYNANFGMANGLEISIEDMTPYGGNGANQPVTGVSWNEAARFVNWLNTSTGNQGAYKFTTNGANDNIALWESGDAGYDAANPYRNSLAKYVLPTIDEWYKAAYYNPETDTYSDYPSGLDTPPTAVAGGMDMNTTVYDQPASQGPADVTNAGGFSPFGIMGLGGNVWEWQETEYDLVNDNVSTFRGFRGGDWRSNSSVLPSSYWFYANPTSENTFVGFRVVSLSSTAAVPEPSSIALLIVGLAGIAGLGVRRRRG